MNTTDLTNINWHDLFTVDGLLLQTAFNPLQITVSLATTLIMAMFIHYVYKKTYDGVLYSKNFNLTVVMTALVVNAIMIGISGNIVLSLGLVGALSIIRFRTAVKDPKDTAFLFWAITIGVINGVAYYELSVIASVIIAIVLIFLTKTKDYEMAYVLILKYEQGTYDKIQPLMRSYFKKNYVRSDSSIGSIIERVIEVKPDTGKLETALSEIRNIQGVESCVLLSSNGAFAE
ncbi:DUF4956 domain-containing protein [candidate division WWE3 bacterium]|uniref:DUF4956 domain-containing protein n=1 Tax=candidate division WWE3 bacterium TaxID=2053526 RepID=A0A955LK01_UNCKA|nr:DUF4956 domain-containing protein [candidate division WWE3 bacterium]